MKLININEIDNKYGKELEEDDSFSFRCYDGLKCFNLCCRNLNLFLYPYDIVRLKRKLKITSGEFIDKYVDVVLREGSFFPEVMLSMSENEEKTCPFLTENGCSVYIDRPDTCRNFPIERGIYYDENGKIKFMRFFRPPDFCLGKNEDTLWTYNAWLKDQDAFLYNEMTIKWAGLKALFYNYGKENKTSSDTKIKMAFMASYNIDEFRRFIFSSTFFKRYKIKKDFKNKIKKDDKALLELGFEWIKHFLLNIKSDCITLLK